MPNYPYEPIFKIINALLFKSYHLLQIVLFCSILQQLHFFYKIDHSESIQHAKLSLWTNFQNNQCITFQIILFAANYAILQHFAATLFFFIEETVLNQFSMPNYPYEPIFKIINALLFKSYHLLQIMLFCSILQQPDHFFKNIFF